MHHSDAPDRAHGRHPWLCVLAASVLATVACARTSNAGTDVPPTNIPQPTPDRTMEAVIRSSPIVIGVASDGRGSPTPAAAAARRATAAPVASRRPASTPPAPAAPPAPTAPPAARKPSAAGPAPAPAAAPVLPPTSTPVPAAPAAKPAGGSIFGPTPVRAATAAPARTVAPSIINPGSANPSSIAPKPAPTVAPR